ncbi:hypothetical protein [Chromobacterium sp. Beijing]|uniref:hypothetical protein n=1 Tax=Chromobacterium sp. Beijing TaxID=2735795 RepID=UPI001F368751|nr:hypothetical protein [Chromobacterium sp. Beijing]
MLKNMISRKLFLETGPATLVPLVHIPLLKEAPRKEGEYKVVEDSLGDLCHFYGDFSGYHIYLIVSTFKKRIIPDSIIYYDKDNGKYSVSIEVTLNDGKTKILNLMNCQAPLCEKSHIGVQYPVQITLEHFSPGTPDALKFHFASSSAKFKFSNNLIPFIHENERESGMDLFQLKIEYIGKAIGKDGTREVSDRLGNGHSTEARILNEFLHKKTNLDAYAVLFKPGQLTDDLNNSSSLLSYTQIIDILEKSLISLFLPEKNVQSRNFPKDGSESHLLLLRNKFSEIYITAESPADYGYLYSDYVQPEEKHRFFLPILGEH